MNVKKISNKLVHVFILSCFPYIYHYYLLTDVLILTSKWTELIKSIISQKKMKHRSCSTEVLYMYFKLNWEKYFWCYSTKNTLRNSSLRLLTIWWLTRLPPIETDKQEMNGKRHQNDRTQLFIIHDRKKGHGENSC